MFIVEWFHRNWTEADGLLKMCVQFADDPCPKLVWSDPNLVSLHPTYVVYIYKARQIISTY